MTVHLKITTWKAEMDSSPISGLGTLKINQPWRLQAACQNYNPDLWFADAENLREKAKTICRTCPVKSPCLEQAIASGERHGIHGGHDFGTKIRNAKRSARSRSVVTKRKGRGTIDAEIKAARAGNPGLTTRPNKEAQSG